MRFYMRSFPALSVFVLICSFHNGPDHNTASKRDKKPATAVKGKVLFSTYNVASLADAGAGTLREAINLANAGTGSDVINITVSGTIRLSGTLKIINGMTI